MSAITSADGFHHLVYSISGTTHTLFLDNSAISINTNGTDIFSAFPNISNLLIGTAGDLSYGYTGYIDDFKVYNRALTITDVSAIYNSNVTIPRVMLTNINNTFTIANSPLSTIGTGGYPNGSACGNDYGNIVISGTSGICYSSDYGKTFALSTGTTGIIYCVSINNNGFGLACTISTLYSSSDFGKTWTAVSAPPSTSGGYYFTQVQVTETGKSYVLLSTNNGRFSHAGTNLIYTSTDNFNSNCVVMTAGYDNGIWYFKFSSPGYGIICYYYANPKYFNGSTWSYVNIPQCCMISMSDNGNYLVSPGYETNQKKIYYATITNGTIGTINTYNSGYSNCINYCSVANNGCCIFYDNGGQPYSGYIHIFNSITQTLYNNNYTNTFDYAFSYGFSPSGNYYYNYHNTGYYYFRSL